MQTACKKGKSRAKWKKKDLDYTGAKDKSATTAKSFSLPRINVTGGNGGREPEGEPEGSGSREGRSLDAAVGEGL